MLILGLSEEVGRTGQMRRNSTVQGEAALLTNNSYFWFPMVPENSYISNIYIRLRHNNVIFISER